MFGEKKMFEMLQKMFNLSDNVYTSLFYESREFFEEFYCRIDEVFYVLQHDTDNDNLYFAIYDFRNREFLFNLRTNIDTWEDSLPDAVDGAQEAEETKEAKEACIFCNNHLVDSDLISDNDYSAITIGDMPRYSRLMFVSGGYKVVPRIEFDVYDDTYGKWNTNGRYYPKFCPECGRKIIEGK